MLCSHCGKELQEAVAFCVHCSKPVGQECSQFDDNVNAVISLVFGIISGLMLGVSFIEPSIAPLILLGFFLSIIGLSLGSRSKQSRFATTGIWLNATVLISWIVLLIVAFTSVFQLAREITKNSLCVNHERLIGFALHDYHATYGALPPLHTVDEEGNPLHSWRVLILPYLEQQALYEQIRLNEPWNSDHNKQFHDQMPAVYKCPVHPGDPRSDCTYSAIADWSFIPAKEAGSVIGLRFEDFAYDFSEGGFRLTPALVEVKEAFNWMDPTADITLENFALGNRVGSHHEPYVYVWFTDNTANGTILAQLQTVAAHIAAARKVAREDNE